MEKMNLFEEERRTIKYVGVLPALATIWTTLCSEEDIDNIWKSKSLYKSGLNLSSLADKEIVKFISQLDDEMKSECICRYAEKVLITYMSNSCKLYEEDINDHKFKEYSIEDALGRYLYPKGVRFNFELKDFLYSRLNKVLYGCCRTNTNLDCFEDMMYIAASLSEYVDKDYNTDEQIVDMYLYSLMFYTVFIVKAPYRIHIKNICLIYEGLSLHLDKTDEDNETISTVLYNFYKLINPNLSINEDKDKYYPLKWICTYPFTKDDRNYIKIRDLAKEIVFDAEIKLTAEEFEYLVHRLSFLLLLLNIRRQ